jgi:hypothetical protein
MFKLRWLVNVPAQLWAIVGMLRGKRKGRFLRRVVKRFRRDAIGSRLLRFECAEPRILLTTVLVWSPPTTDTSPVWTADPLQQNHNDWLDQYGHQVPWSNGAEADFPAAGEANSPAIIKLSSSGVDLVFASTIRFLDPSATGSYYNIQPATSSDQLAVDSANSTTVTVDNAADVATISADIVPYTSGVTTLNTTGNSGTFIIDGAVTVSTVAVNGGAMELDANANLTAATINVNAGTLTIDADGRATATTVNASADALVIEGTLTLADNGGGVNITGTATLSGSSTGSVSLGLNTTLTYNSSASSVFDGQINGTQYNYGALEVDSGTLTLDGANGYGATNPVPGVASSTTINGGTVICGNQFALGEAWNDLAGGGEVPLIMNGGVLDLNGRHEAFTVGDGSGVVRTGILIGDLNGSGGTITDNSVAGGGFLDIDLNDETAVTDNFSGTFQMGAHGQLPSAGIDASGFMIPGQDPLVDPPS